MSYLIRRVLAKPRLILDEMCRLYGKFASYLRRVLCKTRFIFPRINGPNVPTCLLVLKSNSKMSNPKSILSCVKGETRQITTQARYIRILFWFTHIVHFVGLSSLSSQAGCRISFSFCHPTWLAK